MYTVFTLFMRVYLYIEKKKTKKKTFSSLIKNPITKVYKNETHDRINCLSWKKWYCWNIWIFNFNIATTLEDRRQFSRATLIFFLQETLFHGLFPFILFIFLAFSVLALISGQPTIMFSLSSFYFFLLFFCIYLFHFLFK